MKAMRVFFLIMVVALSACGERPSPITPEAQERSRHLVPQDAEIASIYERSCRNCHTVAATGAPLTGDVAAWEPRMNKGMDSLIDNVINGFGGMPPFGLCMDCDAQQFDALIHFMATGE
jgi:cytochrome c5